MRWQVEFAPSAVRGLYQLPPRIGAAVAEFITATLPRHPEQMSKPLRANLDGLRSARRGDYRVLFTLDYEQSKLLVVRIAHRAHVYRSDGGNPDRL
jgi:mRNA-degrading endonuclease RelE of RelBE toxin-antitoxin system